MRTRLMAKRLISGLTSMKHLENNIFWICLVELLFICDCLLLTQREIGKCGQP